jgi:hypothetical protein
VDPTNLALRARQVLLSGVLGLVLLIPASVTPWPGSAATCAAASTTHHVAVVVEHGDGTTLQRCVSFSTASISGADSVDRSGLEWGTVSFGSYGLAVCQLDGEPTSYPPTCWTGTSPFWALFVARGGGSWQTSNLGVSNIALRDGDALGFRYQSQSTHAPPSISGDCPNPTPAPATPTPTPRATPVATVVPTPPPTHRASSRPPTTAGSSSPTPPGSAPVVAPPSGGDGVASATGTVGASPTSADAAASAPASATADPALAVSTGAVGGGPPVGIVLALVAVLAFTALGFLQVRRPPPDLRRPR